MSEVGSPGALPAASPVIVRGAGIAGLWQALLLARGGFAVTLLDDGVTQASHYAGAMLAPWCERESAEPLVVSLGMASLALWKDHFPDVITRGSLVVASGRDQAELERFGAATDGFEFIDSGRLANLEPDLEGRFSRALYFDKEAHVVPRQALATLRALCLEAGVTIHTSDSARRVAEDRSMGLKIDCTGLAARTQLDGLRGVRGEMAIIRSSDVHLSRPVRLAHPRFPIYLVPWPDAPGAGDDSSGKTTTYMVGATMFERSDEGPVRVRSAVELLSAAYAVHPGFGEAEIVELGSGVRPSFRDNLPKVVLRDDDIYVNGMYRHGFLLAPALAEAVYGYLRDGSMNAEIFVDDRTERKARSG